MIARVIGVLVAAAIGVQPQAAPQPQRPDAGTASLRGRVLRADGRPLPRATVQILGAEHHATRSATSDDSGRFEFAALARDQYTLSARKPGFVQLEFGQRRPDEHGQPIALAEGETRDRIDIVLPRNGAISGRVTDENGDPVEGVTVRVLRSIYVADRRLLLELPFAPSRQTNDLGRYRVYGLPPGQYVVAAAVGLRAGAGEYGYTAAFFPGAATAADAQFVPVAMSEDVSGIDLTVGRVRTVRVRGVARNSTGQPLIGGVMLGLRFDKYIVAIPPASASLAADGQFEFAAVAPGDYVLQAVGRRPPQSRDGWDDGEFAWQYLTVRDRSLTDLTIATSKGSTLRGRVLFDGDARHDVSISAFPTDFDRSPNTGGPPAFARLRGDATFELAGLHGPRRLTLSGGSQDWSITSIHANGLDITDAVVPFGSSDQSLADVEVTVTTHGAEVAGTVIDGRGQRVDNYSVIVFATDRARWYRNSRFMRFATPQSEGSFRVTRLPPGEYFVAAIDRMDGTDGGGEWQDPAVLESLIPHATRIVLAEAQQLTLSPRLVVR
jgi:hypothetical protein